MASAALPWFFGHQTCRPTANGAARFLNALNCRMHFPDSHRTLEAYATWFAAVFASAALFWAWKAFNVQSETLEAQLDALREQQRDVFLNSLSKEYKKRLEDAALWIVNELQIQSADTTEVKSSLTSQQKVLFLFGLIIVGKNVEKISEVRYSINVQNCEMIAREYDRKIDYHKLEVLKKGSLSDCTWVQALMSFEKMKALYQTLFFRT